VVRSSSGVQQQQWCAAAVRQCAAAAVRSSSGARSSSSAQQRPTGTPITDTRCFCSFADACHGLGMVLQPEIFPAATDSRFIR
jgi:hypothetical protein